jgi:hypothetical protein
VLGGKIKGMWKRWTETTLINIVSVVIIALIPAGIMAHLLRIQSGWSGPLAGGVGVFAMAAIAILALDAMRRLPPKRVIPNLKNIESCVRDWLNNFQYSVKKSPNETTYFRYLVTVDSGTKLLIGRTKDEFQEYVQIRADMRPNTTDMESFNALSDLQKAVLIGSIRLELARRNVGYRGLTIPADDFYISKRIPIRETLTEHEFIGAVDEMEAAAHSVSLVFALEIVKSGTVTPENLKGFGS